LMGGRQKNIPGGENMNTISTTSSISPLAEQQESGSLRNSLSAVVSALSGRPVTSEQLTNQKISEEVLFTAQVHAQLKGESPEAADRMLQKVPRTMERNITSRKSQPLFQAVDQFLNGATRRGEINRRLKNRILRTAFGKAQLDSHTARLGRNPREISESTKGESILGNIDRALAQSETNSPISRKVLKEFQQRIQCRGEISQKRATMTNTMLDQFASNSTGINDETLVNTTPADYNSIATRPNELVYRPEGTGGGVQVFTPCIYTDELQGVSIVSHNGTSLTLEHQGVMKDGRREFVSGEAGSSLSGNVSLRLEFVDGTSALVDLGGSGVFARVPFSAA
jgi:hypothetical protein